jgi:trehalose 6-phosphate phosphatase
MNSTVLSRELAAPPSLDLARTALFLDLDGTLAPIAPTPQEVGPEPARSRLLARLSAQLNGRLAVLTGRALSDVDRVLEGEVSCVAAVHGLVKRRPDGGMEAPSDGQRLDGAREAFARLSEADPRLIFEDKVASVALHYRQAPEREAEVSGLAERLAATDGLKLQRGKRVAEVRLPGPDKGDSLRDFMGMAPFAGATPVFVGDDLTDEDGFSAVKGLGGFGVLVGAPRPTDARFRLPGVAETLDWLEGALQRKGPS